MKFEKISQNNKNNPCRYGSLTSLKSQQKQIIAPLKKQKVRSVENVQMRCKYAVDNIRDLHFIIFIIF